MELRERVGEVRRRIKDAAERSGRDPSEISLLAVTKRHDLGVVKQAIEAGLTLFGENYVQEAKEKIQGLGDLRASTTWHFIGHLQRNKARLAVQLFDCIQTVDNLRLAEALNRRARDVGKRMPVLCQVNLAGEEQKSGAGPEVLEELIQRIMDLSSLELQGLMLIPPFSPDPENVRPWFRRLRELRDDLESRLGLAGRLKELSMGMTHDFEVAVEEGATIVRVGTALFGPREY